MPFVWRMRKRFWTRTWHIVRRMATDRYDVPMKDLDDAARLVIDKLNEALVIIAERELDLAVSVQAVTQMAMRFMPT